MLGMTNDPVFGPVIMFGAGGVDVEVMKDRAVTLPPLNHFLVTDLIQSTHVAKMLGPSATCRRPTWPPLENVLLRVSEMVCELPWLTEMDINPLIVDEHGALAPTRAWSWNTASPSADRYAHMAIYPYPAHLVTHWQLPAATTC